MQWIRFRPSFHIDLMETREQAIAKLSEEFRLRNDREHFVLSDEYGELHLPRSEHRLWSPYLAFYIHHKEGKSFVDGKFSPRLHILGFVWFVYLVMAFTFFFSCILACSQWVLGVSPWGLWLAFTAAVVVVILYVIAHIGQQWSADQMMFLHQELENILQASGVHFRRNQSTGSGNG